MDKSRLFDLCKRKNVTISELEKSLKLSNGSLRKDGDIKSERLLAIADYFNVSMEYLMGRDNEISNSSDIEKDLIQSFRELDEEAQRQLVLMLAFLKSQDKK